MFHNPTTTSPPCPACSGQSSVVLDTRMSDTGEKRRRRKCKTCDFRFSTYERVDQPYPPWSISNMRKTLAIVRDQLSDTHAELERAIQSLERIEPSDGH